MGPDTLDTDSAMVSITARGLLMLSPRPRLILTTPTVDSDMPDTDWDTLDTPVISDTDTDSDTAMDSCTARGLLMLSLKLRLILTTPMGTRIRRIRTGTPRIRRSSRIRIRTRIRPWTRVRQEV